MKSVCFCPLCQMHSPLCIERAHIPYSARWVEKGPQGHHVIYERYLRTVHPKKNHLIQVRLLTMKRRNIAKGIMDPTKIKLHNLSQTSAAKYWPNLSVGICTKLLSFSLNLDKGAWPRKISNPEFYSSSPTRRSRYKLPQYGYLPSVREAFKNFLADFFR